MAGLALVLIAVLVVGAFVAAQLIRSPAGAVQGAAASPIPSASPSDLSSTVPFNCRSGTSLARGPAPAVAYIDAMNVTRGAGYDRVTIQFTDGAPALTDLTTQNSATFPGVRAGESESLSGQAGALLTLHSTDAHTKYRGQTDLKTGSPLVLEIRQVQDGGGTVQWAVGLARQACYRMAFIDQPTRLVIDFQAGVGASSR
jgi:hypothetical protein